MMGVGPGLYGEMLGEQHQHGMAGYGIGNHGFGMGGVSPEQVNLGFEEGIWGHGGATGHAQQEMGNERPREAERGMVKSEPRWE